MSSAIRDFETACSDAGHTPTAAFKAAGLNPSTWFRWKSGAVSPTLRSFEAAQKGLENLKGIAASVDDGSSMAPGESLGAGIPDGNVSRTAVRP